MIIELDHWGHPKIYWCLERDGRLRGSFYAQDFALASSRPKEPASVSLAAAFRGLKRQPTDALYLCASSLPAIEATSASAASEDVIRLCHTVANFAIFCPKITFWIWILTIRLCYGVTAVLLYLFNFKMKIFQLTVTYNNFARSVWIWNSLSKHQRAVTLFQTMAGRYM